MPGTTEFRSRRADEVVAFGEEFGWPVAIKAAYGGGGRGMKVVQRGRRGRRRRSSRPSARRKAYFGRDECYVERYLTWPRHVEMQIFGDTHGNVRVGRRARLLGPAPPPEADRGEPRRRRSPTRSRQAMGEAAVKVAKAVRLRTTPAPSSSSTRTASSSSSR